MEAFRLGALIATYRRAAGLTQQELAERLSPPVSRSLIAHVEQSIRVPPPSVLSRMCAALRIPEELWVDFRSRALSDGSVRHTEHIQKPEPRIVAVAGIMGSGKTTLARALVPIMRFANLPEASQGVRYLEDLARNRPRWAFETQLAFLASKAVHLRELLSRGRSVLLDRSLSEDIEIFAEYFRQRGEIDERSFATYATLAKHFLETLPPPDLVVLCRCSLDAAHARIQLRGRGDVLHTREHLTEINNLYSQWAARQHDSPFLMLDSEALDLRDSAVVHRIARDIESRLLPRSKQLELFSAPPTASTEATTDLLQPSLRLTAVQTTEEFVPEPVAYLAAPFTAVAASRVGGAQSMLFEQPHGEIPRGQYRSSLLAVELTLRTLGIRTLIPHRDVNRWGKRVLTPAAAARKCTEHVLACDLVIALLGSSHGAHYELGLGLGNGKPCIVIQCDETTASFIGNGIADMHHPNCLVVSCRKVQHISKALETAQVRDFLARHVPIQRNEDK